MDNSQALFLAFAVCTTMAKKKKRKAILTNSTPIMVRVQSSQLRKIDKWIAKQRGKLGHSEAIRRLVDRGLKAEE
jgi:hypothetical protein